MEIERGSFAIVTDTPQYEVRLQYPARGCREAVSTCYMRREVLTRLERAAAKLPAGCRFRIWDAWRPFALQKELYDLYSGEIIRNFGLEQQPRAQQREVICRFVSEPVEDPLNSPVHTTGGAVDLTIVDSLGREWNMGTPFDAFSEQAYTLYYAGEPESECCRNRRILCQVMQEAGFTNLASEWWHFDYGDSFWRRETGNKALYTGVFTERELRECL